MQKNYDIRIETANTDEKYKRLRALWCEVFGDLEAYVDAFYKNFEGEIEGYVALDESGEVLSALTCYKAGTFEGKDVYVSYAVCTREDSRSKGLAAALCTQVRDKVIAEGGLSIVSPAEASLEEYYDKLGYKPFFYTSEKAALSPDYDSEDYIEEDEYDLDIGDPGQGSFAPKFEMEQTSSDIYNRYRESFLAETPHISLSDAMLRMVEAESENGEGLYVINRGDAICSLAESGGGRVVLTELIVNPLLREFSYDIDIEIASLIAKHFAAVETLYCTPGMGRCQSMIAGDAEAGPAYFGFPID